MIDENVNPGVKAKLQSLVDNFENFDISTLKYKLNAIMEEVDLRDDEDRTDFSFMKRRRNDA